jgi:hypothetical protein
MPGPRPIGDRLDLEPSPSTARAEKVRGILQGPTPSGHRTTDSGSTRTVTLLRRGTASKGLGATTDYYCFSGDMAVHLH